MYNMPVQMTYGEPKAGMPGLLVDRANYGAVTRSNGVETGKLLFGLGVVQGEEPGKNVVLPKADSTAAQFEGVVMYSANVEMDREGKVYLEQGQIIDICQHGKLWVQVTDDAEPAYGVPVYLIADGTDAGKFASSAPAGEDGAAAIAVKAKFLGEAEDGLAPAKFYDMPQA